jgi:hypothetical protein
MKETLKEGRKHKWKKHIKKRKEGSINERKKERSIVERDIKMKEGIINERN